MFTSKLAPSTPSVAQPLETSVPNFMTGASGVKALRLLMVAQKSPCFDESSHTILVVRDFAVKNSAHIVPQPPYSPDLAPSDFWLLPKLKKPLRIHGFISIEKIKTAPKKGMAIHKSSPDYRRLLLEVDSNHKRATGR
ncbi:hypothetical protein NECAME_11025 [Necator americanus]|uniref:Tc1-like transposase DDE domain-containing protein n=1 Tax=Necator americanus TaxID=51031 RepID=W2T8Y7_NECAM|nr:hypothetical protein NECAME_11025 [Necator americanus]ETN77452.1 hypothetical protein NECAME_11025 [Necator americanus]